MWDDKDHPLLSFGVTGGQIAHTWSFLDLPLKSLGYNGSNELFGRLLGVKLRPQQADGLFHLGDTEIGEDWHFFYQKGRIQKISM